MKSGLRKWLLAGAALFAMVGASFTAVSVDAAPAEAASVADGFNPSKIIDDGLFYDGNAMSVAEVQSFLNQRVPQCWLGRSGYEVGKWVTWGGVATQLASKCTKDYVSKTESRAANAYCAAYAGGGNESSAQIIQKVGKACGISQRVLLITLEKEQSLISDPWPNNEQYFRAMGYACPDSGPGGTANCDRTQGGFFQQVYRAAWQLKVYKAFPNDYNYKAFKTNYIQYHPNAGCGGTNVYIENWATAALYIYTPYQPNRAAINAGTGTGDGCSSYGNRNFYVMYKSWFGSPSGISVNGAIGAMWDQQGGPSGALGSPTANAVHVNVNGGGLVQEFTGGAIFLATGQASAVAMQNGPFLTNFRNAGYVQGAWGWPTDLANCGLVNGGCTMGFKTGTVAYSVQTGSAFIPRALADAWFKLGSANGPLGYPQESGVSYGGDHAQRFAGGYFTWSNAGGAQVVDKAIEEVWLKLGAGIRGIGVPAGAAVAKSANGGGTIQEFTRGAVWKSPSGIVQMSDGLFRAQYEAAGGVSGSWGWPAENAKCQLIENGCFMKFQNGIGMWSANTGLVLTSDEAFRIWNREGGSFGYPKAAPKAIAANGGGTLQEFTRGAVWTSPFGTIQMSNGLFRNQYEAAGGASGTFGWPAENAKCRLVGDGCAMKFQNGIGMWSAGTGLVLTSDEAFNLWNREIGSFGYPKTAPKQISANGGGTLQEFTRGAVWASPSGTVQMENGQFRARYEAAGGAAGSWGWPAENAKCLLVEDGCYMKFQNGIGMWSARTGLVLTSDEAFQIWNREIGSFGYPRAAPVSNAANGGGTVQEFTRGAVWVSPFGTIQMSNGPFKAGYLAVGGPSSEWGWPAANAKCSGDSCVMEFQHGTVNYDQGDFVFTRKG